MSRYTEFFEERSKREDTPAEAVVANRMFASQNDNLKITTELVEETIWVAHMPNIGDVFGTGDTEQEAKKNFVKELNIHLDARNKIND